MNKNHMGTSARVTIYTPNDRSGGLLQTALQTVREVHRARPIIWRLFVRDFKAQYQQNVLGYVWAFLGPLLGIFSFVFLNYAGILNPGDIGISYPVYVFVGTSTWGLLVGSVATVSGSLRNHADLILRTNIPKVALVAASFATIVYTLVINLCVITLLLVAFRILPGWGGLLFPLLMLPIVVFGIGVGLAISVVGIIARDVSAIVTQILSVIMYFTPVVYLSHSVQQPILRKLIFLNPLTYLIDVPRSVLFGTPIEFWWEYAGACGLSLIMLIAGIKIFHLVQDLIAERL